MSVCLSLSLSVSSGVVLSPVHCAMLCVGVVGSSDVQPGIVVAPSDTVAVHGVDEVVQFECCLLYTSPSPRDRQKSRMPSSA